jgi:hypothetical protein
VKIQRTAICRNEIVQGEYRRKCKRNAMHRDEIMQEWNWEEK